MAKAAACLPGRGCAWKPLHNGRGLELVLMGRLWRDVPPLPAFTLAQLTQTNMRPLQSCLAPFAFRIMISVDVCMRLSKANTPS